MLDRHERAPRRDGHRLLSADELPEPYEVLVAYEQGLPVHPAPRRTQTAGLAPRRPPGTAPLHSISGSNVLASRLCAPLPGKTRNFLNSLRRSDSSSGRDDRYRSMDLFPSSLFFEEKSTINSPSLASTLPRCLGARLRSALLDGDLREQARGHRRLTHNNRRRSRRSAGSSGSSPLRSNT